MARSPASGSGSGRRLGSSHRAITSNAPRKGRRRSARSYAAAIVLCSVAGFLALYGNNDGSIHSYNMYFSGTTLAGRFLLAAEKYDVAEHEDASKISSDTELEWGSSNSTSARSSVGERQMLKIVSSIVLLLPNHSHTYDICMSWLQYR